MKAEFKSKWIEALRSGKYEQGQGYLRRCEGYCCLGVLLDVSNLGKWCDFEYNVGGLHLHTGLGSKRLSLFGVQLGEENDLVEMNDYQRKSFPEIADWIEANL